MPLRVTAKADAEPHLDDDGDADAVSPVHERLQTVPYGTN
jgi:hypothetical protein